MTTSLYRFRKLNKYTLDELRNSYLYFSSIDKLNDPMECFYRLFFDEGADLYRNLFKHFLKNINNNTNSTKGKNSNFDDLDRWISENLSKTIDSLTHTGIWVEDLRDSFIDSYIKRYGKKGNIKSKVNTYIKGLRKLVINEKLICSFSKIGGSATLNDGEILMWAHYAGGHSGICMEFSEIMAQDRNLQSKLAHRDIEYHNDDIKNLQFSVGLAASNNENKLDFLNEKMQLGALQLRYNKKYESIYNAKLKAWDYEKEYRYSIPKSDLPKQKLHYDFMNLKSITFGINTPQNKRDEVKKIIEQKCRESGHRVAFYKVDIRDGGFVREPLGNSNGIY